MIERSLGTPDAHPVEATVVDEAPLRFEEFFGEEHARLFGALCFVTGDRHEAEEIMQDAFLRLWDSGDREIANDAVAEAFAQAMRRGEAVRDPLAWVTRAAFKIAAGALKERRRTDYPLAEQTYEMPEPAVELVAAFARLSPKQRAAVILHHRDGYTLAEVAEASTAPTPSPSWEGTSQGNGCRGDPSAARTRSPEHSSRPASLEIAQYPRERVPERDQPGAPAIPRQVEQPPPEVLVADRRVAAVSRLGGRYRRWRNVPASGARSSQGVTLVQLPLEASFVTTTHP